MSRLFNVLIGINLLLPWIISVILPIQSSLFLNEVVFFGCVFLMAVSTARIAKLLPHYARWIWALSIANLIAAGLLNSPALATAFPTLLRALYSESLKTRVFGVDGGRKAIHVGA